MDLWAEVVSIREGVIDNGGDYKDCAQATCSAVFEAGFVLLHRGEWGQPYPHAAQLQALLDSMPDGANCPRAFNDWWQAHQESVQTLLSA